MSANVITWAGRSLFQSRLAAPFTGNGAVSSAPIYLEWGFTNTTVFTQNAAITDVSLFQPAPQGKVAASGGAVTYLHTNTNSFVDTLQIAATITANTGAITINEVGLFDSSVNCVSTTLAVAANSSQTALTVASSTGFPASGNSFYAQMGNEVVLVTGGSSGTSWTVVRAQKGTAMANSTYPVGQAITFGGDGGACFVNTSVSSQSTTANTNALGGSMIAHADFANIGLSNGDSIAFTLSIQLS